MREFFNNYGLKLKNNSILRCNYYKYFHPKEVLITNGVLHEDFIRSAALKEADRLLAEPEKHTTSDEPVDSEIIIDAVASGLKEAIKVTQKTAEKVRTTINEIDKNSKDKN